MISIFTPTHNTKYLLDAYHSLTEQTYQDYEWLILPSKDVAIPTEIMSDSHVRILPDAKSTSVGLLKHMCCAQARGELLLELDHDDMLLPTCLQEIHDTYVTTKADFIYSDCIHFFNDHKCEVFHKEFGWESYKIEWRGRNYTVMSSFEPSARSLCEIFWAPNHVRVWSKEAYDTIGGHSPSLEMADDHDILIRTYLAGYKFEHIKKALYAYRRHDENSFLIHNQAVQVQQAINRDRYIYPLIDEECRRNGWPIVRIGSDESPGKIMSNRFKAAHPNGSVGMFKLQDFLHHVPTEDVSKLMNLLYDKLVPGGWLMASTPSVSDNEGKVGRGAYQDPLHRSYWSMNNFWYFTDKNYAKYVPSLHCKFQMVRGNTVYPTQWHRQNLIPYVDVDLYAVKGQRMPGKCNI